MSHHADDPANDKFARRVAAFNLVEGLAPVGVALAIDPAPRGDYWLLALVAFFIVAFALNTWLLPRLGASPLVASIFAGSILGYVGTFAFLYLLIDANTTRAFSESLSRVDALYLAATTLTTVGAGSIYPLSELARSVVTIESLVGLFIIAVSLALFLRAVRRH